MLALLTEIHEYFAEHGGNYSIFRSLYPRNAIYIIQNYVKAVPEDVQVRVYAVGGDGILYDCINGVAGLRNCEIAAMPFGNTNDFVLAFGNGHDDLFRSVKKQVEAETVPTDVIKLDGQYAINFIAAGIEAECVFYLENLRRWLEGNLRLPSFIYPLMFMLGALVALFRRDVRDQYYQVELDDGRIVSGRGLGLNIGNGPVHGGNKASQLIAMPNDGELNLIFLKNNGIIGGLIRADGYTRGAAYKGSPHYITTKLRTAHIWSNRHLIINMDGESYIAREAFVEILPNFVNVVAPDGLTYCKRMI